MLRDIELLLYEPHPSYATSQDAATLQ